MLACCLGVLIHFTLLSGMPGDSLGLMKCGHYPRTFHIKYICPDIDETQMVYKCACRMIQFVGLSTNWVHKNVLGVNHQR